MAARRLSTGPFLVTGCDGANFHSPSINDLPTLMKNAEPTIACAYDLHAIFFVYFLSYVVIVLIVTLRNRRNGATLTWMDLVT
jgi:hypothetical protein